MNENKDFIERLDVVIGEFLARQNFFLQEHNRENNPEFKEKIFEQYQKMVFIAECLETLRDISTDVMAFTEKHPVTFLNNEYRKEKAE